jgi:hypothetical protein
MGESRWMKQPIHRPPYRKRARWTGHCERDNKVIQTGK